LQAKADFITVDAKLNKVKLTADANGKSVLEVA
jgi:hypothetical protein